MPKKKKYPKQPKQSAGKATWERYLERVKEVSKYNKELEKLPEQKRKIKEQARKLKQS